MTTAEWDWIVLTVHVLGAIVWVGGTISLGIVVWGLRRTFPNDPGMVRRIASRIGRTFAWVMWPALGVTIATGLANLSWYVPPVENWTGIPGSVWLSLAVGLVVLMTVAAGLHTFVVGPRVRRLRDRPAPAAEVAPWVGLERGLEAGTLLSAIAVIVVMVLLGSI